MRLLSTRDTLPRCVYQHWAFDPPGPDPRIGTDSRLPPFIIVRVRVLCRGSTQLELSRRHERGDDVVRHEGTRVLVGRHERLDHIDQLLLDLA